MYTDEPGVWKLIYSAGWSAVPLCVSVLRAVRLPTVVPFVVFSDTGRRFCTLAGNVGGAAVAVFDGIGVKAGIDVAVARMTGVADGAVVGVD